MDLCAKSGCSEHLTKANLERTPVVAPQLTMMIIGFAALPKCNFRIEF